MTHPMSLAERLRALLIRFENLHHVAVQMDETWQGSDKRLREAWAESDKAKAELTDELTRLSAPQSGQEESVQADFVDENADFIDAPLDRCFVAAAINEAWRRYGPHGKNDITGAFIFIAGATLPAKPNAETLAWAEKCMEEIMRERQKP